MNEPHIRDTLLSYPTHKFIPPHRLEPTSQPTMASWIWKEVNMLMLCMCPCPTPSPSNQDRMYILYSTERNGWGPAKCTRLHAPNSVPPPDWMRKYVRWGGQVLIHFALFHSLLFFQSYTAHSSTYEQCRKMQQWSGNSGYEQKVGFNLRVNISLSLFFFQF